MKSAPFLTGTLSVINVILFNCSCRKVNVGWVGRGQQDDDLKLFSSQITAA